MTISELSVKRPVFALMLISFLVVLGIFSFRDLGVDLFPKADPANVNVSISIPGASSEEMTSQVILPLEAALNTISGLDTLSAQSQEGSARINCTFVLERDIEGAAQDVREKVAGALKSLPPNILPPVIQKSDPDADPILTMIVSGNKSLRDTTEISDKQIKRVLETVDGVGAVTITGARTREIRVFADAEKLNAYNITISQLQKAIQSENVETPAGDMVRGNSDVSVRTLGRIDAVSEFGDIIVANVNGSPIRVNDIGRIEDSFPEPTSWNVLNGKESVRLDVRRQSGTNTVQIVQTVKDKMQVIKKTLPKGIDYRIIADGSQFINASVSALKEHLFFGSILASLIVLIFMRNWRMVFIASLAIPTSIIATFTLIKAMDFTLNNMTLLGLTLAVGIVIDDAIVVLENIFRYIEEKGYDAKTAAIEATQEITLAVVATTLSLVIIFVPIAFMTGYARRYVNQFGWTMAFSVLVSMLVAFTLTPMMSSLMLKRIARKKGDTENGAAKHAAHETKSGFFSAMSKAYNWLMVWSLDHRAVVVLFAIAVFLSTIPLNNMVGRDWIPADDQSEFSLNSDLPLGTSYPATQKFAIALADRVSKLPEVEFANPYGPQELSSHFHMYVRLVDIDKRKKTNLDVAKDIRKLEEDYPNLRGRIAFPSALGGGEGNWPVSIAILGPDLQVANSLAMKIHDTLKQTPGFTDLNIDLDGNGPELQIQVDRKRASELGVRASDVGSAVRLMIAGQDEISTYKEGNEEYSVTMQLLPEQQRDPAILARLMIPSSKVGQVRLDNIATVQRGLTQARMKRIARQYAVSVNGNTDYAPDVASVKLREIVNKISLPPGYTTKLQGTIKILDETNKNLIMTLLLACIFMYMVLAAQFESLLHPFAIMLSLPLSVPFALLTLWMTNRTLNLWSSLGVLLLLGVVKKNGILQIDYANKLRREGMPLRDAVLEACQVRLRPILMTTFSIIAGLIPTALGVGAGAQQRSAIAVTIIGGQTLCLLLTLVVTPVAYSLLSEVSEMRLFAWIKWPRLRRAHARS
jgi:hydrophobic/amphiphilic exporter-1 (mainly G- bacteria), HAE1 family